MLRTRAGVHGHAGGPPLSYVPAAAPLAVLLGVAAVLLVAAAVTASVLLIRGVSLDQLRETPT